MINQSNWVDATAIVILRMLQEGTPGEEFWFSDFVERRNREVPNAPVSLEDGEDSGKAILDFFCSTAALAVIHPPKYTILADGKTFATRLFQYGMMPSGILLGDLLGEEYRELQAKGQ